MRNGKLFFSFFSLALVFSLFFLGCSPRGSVGKPCEVSFSWWGNESRNQYTIEGIKLFEKENPSVKVLPSHEAWEEYEKNFGKKLLSGNCADVMQVNFDWLYKYSGDGLGFYDMESLDEYIDLYNFTMDDLSFGTMKGRLNAIPISFNTAIPVYDKKVLDELALDIPSTWDELFNLAKMLKKKDMCVFTLSNRHLFFLAVAWFEQTYSKKVFTEQGRLDISLEEVGLIFDFVKRLESENVVYSPSKGIRIAALRERKVIGAVLWCSESSLILTEAKALGGNGVLGNFITTPGARESGWYLKPASMYAIKKDTEHPREAAMLVNYLLNSQDFALLQKNEKGVPISNKSLTALMEKGQLESMQYTALMKIRFNSATINSMIPIMEDSQLITAFSSEVFAYLDGGKSKNEAAEGFWNFVNLRK